MAQTKTTEPQIYIKDGYMSLISVDYSPIDTIGRIKQIVEVRNKVAIESLSFMGKELDFSKSLFFYNIHKDEVLVLKTREFNIIQVFLESSDKMMEINCNLSDTIEKFKEKIRNKYDIPFYQQKLSYLGSSLDDDMILSSYNIKQGSKITMEL